MFAVLLVVWHVWVIATTASYIQHGTLLVEGCHFVYRTHRLTAWPLARTSDVLCWQRSILHAVPSDTPQQ